MDNAIGDRALNALVSAFGNRPASIGQAPGRVELVGNHTDYNGGFVLTCAVNLYTAVAIVPNGTLITNLTSNNVSFQDASVCIRAGATALTDQNRWTGYVCGVMNQLEIGVDEGWDIAIVSDVPDGSGISSSAAILVATACAFLAFLRLEMEPMEIAKLCRDAENGAWVGAPVGLLDQFSSACGKLGQAMFLDCKSHTWSYVPLPGEMAEVVIFNTNVKHSLASGSGYKTRRDECEAGARQLSADRTSLLRDVTHTEYLAGWSTLPVLTRDRVEHVFSENQRVLNGLAALQNRDMQSFGDILNKSHESCKQKFGNTCHEIDRLQSIVTSCLGTYGAKLSGGGWGGSVIAITQPSRTQAVIESVHKAYGTGLSVITTTAAEGATGWRV